MKYLIFAAICLMPLSATLAQDEAEQQLKPAPNTITVYQYINQYANMAVKEMLRTGIPASITLVQGIVESSFGNSGLSMEANNHFGIKCGNDWTGEQYQKEDDDYDKEGKLTKSCFRRYPNAEKSFYDHSEFLMTRSNYQSLFKIPNKDYKKWAYGLKDAGYATLPAYPEILISNIERYKLYLYDQITTSEAQAPVVAKTTEEVTKKLEKTIDFSSIFVNTIDLNSLEPSDIPDVYRHNKLKMIVVKQEDTPESVAAQYGIPLDNLLKYNELKPGDAFIPFQFVYLEPKRHWYKGEARTHTVQANENMYLIAQLYGIKVSLLCAHNLIIEGQEPVEGAVIYLKEEAQARPLLRKSRLAQKVGAQPLQPQAPPVPR